MSFETPTKGDARTVVERDVVVAVVQEPHVREQVDDLLLAEVPATCRTERRQALAPEGLLVALGVRAGREEHDDLPRLRLARVDQLPHPTRDAPRLTCPPVLRRLGEARLLGDEQLDGMAEHRIRELGRGRQRLVLVAERVAEEMVDRREHLRTRAVVPGSASMLSACARRARKTSRSAWRKP